MLFRINAGHIPNGSWIHNDKEGGGRIIGEMCHFIDFARHCARSKILSVQADAARNTRGSPDDVTAIIRFESGSLATIAYTGLGDTTVPKEQYEIFSTTFHCGRDSQISQVLTFYRPQASCGLCILLWGLEAQVPMVASASRLGSESGKM